MAKISAGSYDLNRWLYGGYETDIITVLYGAPGTGKTNFCLLVAVSQAKKGNKVIYMDTEGGFSVERIKQLAGDEFETAMKNIVVLKPTNFEEQKSDFKKLLQYVKDDSGISLIVVDGMTMLYRIDYAEARDKSEKEIQKVNSELVNQMRTLAEIARKSEMPVIVTNQVYNWDEKTRMVGGQIMQYWGKCLIELTRDDGRRAAYIRKHRSLPETSLQFQITNDGVKKKGWI